MTDPTSNINHIASRICPRVNICTNFQPNQKAKFLIGDYFNIENDEQVFAAGRVTNDSVTELK